MPNSLTSQGLTTATQAELLAVLTTAYQNIYGATIDLDSDTPDGQMMNIYIQAAEDLLDLVVQVYNSFDPDNAIGVVLDQRVAINGIQRKGGSFSQARVHITITGSVNLYGQDMPSQQVFTISDSQGNQWQLLTTQLGAVTGDFTFQAVNSGAVTAAPNSLTIQVTIVLGVSAVNNPSANFQTGVNSETDAVLKVRRQKATSIQSQGFLQGLEAALENINGIQTAVVHENDSGSTDGNGIPGHSIWVVVKGTPTVGLALPYNSATTYSYGQIASFVGVNYISVANSNLNHTPPAAGFWNVYNPIAQAIYSYRNAGCGMFGSSSYTITQIDGSSFTVLWDFVVLEELFARFTANSINGINPPSIAAIQSYLAANFTPGIAAEVNINQLATLVQLADPNTLVTSSGLGKAASGPFTNLSTPDALNKQFVVDAINVIILPMIMTCPNGIQVISGPGGTVTGTTVTIVHGGNTIQFGALGGYEATLTYSKDSGAGSINASTGLYTSSTIGTDVVRVTDALGNFATATITVT